MIIKNRINSWTLRNKIKGTSSINKNKLALTSASFLTLFTMKSALAVCAISTDNRYEHIESITLNNASLTNQTTLKNNDVLELTPGYSGYAYRNDWSIFIDLNNNGNFSDTDERVFTTSSASNGVISAPLVLAQNINVSSTDMRVVFHSQNIDSDGCNYNSYGDSADFIVNVGEQGDGGNDTDTGLYELSQTPRGGNSEHILSVAFGSDSNTSGNNDGYADFTQIKTFTISDGTGVLLEPTSNWDSDWAIWIDSNKNNKFESDENVFSATTKRSNTIEGELNLNGIQSGITRMRIAMNGDGEATSGGFKYGEIEDYTVNVESEEPDTGIPDTGVDDEDNDDKLYGSHIRWEHDNVNVKIFRFEFSDAQLSWTKSRIESEMNEVVEYFDKESYGRFDVTYEIHSEVLLVNDRVSNWDDKSSNDWKAYYADKLMSLGEDDFENIDDDTIYLIIAPQISDWGIKAGVNPGAIRIYDTGDERSQAGGIAHEMGHAMGLHHAQGLDGKDSVFGVGDYDSEMVGYGNFFSMMGNNAWDFGGFNLYYKNFFASWNIEDEVPLIDSSGTYKIYAFDQGTIAGNLGVRLKAGNGEVTYWVEYRTNDGADTNGVLINTEGHFPDEDARSYYYGSSFLLDMTPNTFPDDVNDDYDDFDDFIDGALVVGKSYTDKWDAFTITVKRTGGVIGTASAWIEVDIEMH